MTERIYVSPLRSASPSEILRWSTTVSVALNSRISDTAEAVTDAQSTASAADSKAQAAQDAAETASATASNAESTAVAASGSAATADAKADAAQSTADGALPKTGDIQIFGAVLPDGWLECNGSVVIRTEYPDLFSEIGITYGAGDGSTTFGLPLGVFVLAGSASGSDVALDNILSSNFVCGIKT